MQYHQHAAAAAGQPVLPTEEYWRQYKPWLEEALRTNPAVLAGGAAAGGFYPQQAYGGAGGPYAAGGVPYGAPPMGGMMPQHMMQPPYGARPVMMPPRPGGW